MMTKRITQSNDKNCLACVLAMIVGESEQYVLDWFEHQGPAYRDEDSWIFLAHHGIYLGIYVQFEDSDGGSMHPKSSYDITVKIQGRPCYIVVRSSRFEGKFHAIFWDGHKVYDPNPEMQDDPPLSLYMVDCFYPFMLTKERESFFAKMRGVHDGE